MKPISVEDQLPEFEEKVLIYIAHDDEWTFGLLHSIDRRGTNWLTYPGSAMIETPTHWMPDPPSPESYPVEDDVNACEIEAKDNPVYDRVTIYLHGCDQSNYETFQNFVEDNDIHSPEPAMQKLAYALYEVKATLDVDFKTGEYHVVSMEEC